MKIGIIGAGFTGLSAAYDLLKNGHEVTIFEKDSAPGGLAIGYKENGWDWTLEKHYHHWFTNDTFVLALAKEIHHEVLITKPKTSVFVNENNYQLDTLLAFLKFPKLPVFDRLRMILTLGLLRINPFWKPLEKINAISILPKMMGNKSWNMLWRPQLTNKMGNYANDISLVWFWARMHKRTSSLAYPKNGFLAFADALASAIEKKGGTLRLETQLVHIIDDKSAEITVKTKKGKSETYQFDKIIVTLPSYLFLQCVPQLPDNYKNSLVKLKGLGATNMVLRLNKQLMHDNTYWLSICQTPSPVMVVVEHTNLIDKKNYNNEHIVYIGNYPKIEDELFTASDQKLLKLYDPILTKINPNYKKYIINYKVFRVPFAQPVIPINYSKMIPSFTTPLPNVFLANIEQVYPWDRGTNYAVELGKKIAQIVSNSFTA